MKTPSSKTSKGFTLIELLVAMAITTIIITILVSITGLSLDTWNRSRSEIRASRQGKAMIDSMSRDFESLVVRKGNNFEWLYAAYKVSSDGPNGTASPNAADLVFFSAATDRYNGNIGDASKDNGGDVSTIAYQLTYKDPISDSSDEKFKTFVLYRKIINPDVTFGVPPNDGILGTVFDTANVDDDTLLTKAQAADAGQDSAGSSVNTEIDDGRNFICENIYQFTVVFHVEVTKADGTLGQIQVPLGDGSGSDSSEIFKVHGSGIHLDSIIAGPIGSGITNDMIKAGRLTSVEISLTVLTDFGIAQMRNRTFNGTDLDDFIAENSYQFSKLIPVPGS